MYPRVISLYHNYNWVVLEIQVIFRGFITVLMSPSNIMLSALSTCPKTKLCDFDSQI